MHKRGIDEMRIYGLLDAGIIIITRVKMQALYPKSYVYRCFMPTSI
jgi:hypothetical protein